MILHGLWLLGPWTRGRGDLGKQEQGVRILIVDDHPQWRGTLRRLLDDNPHFHVIGDANDGIEAIQKVTRLHPDVVLLDIGLPRLNGFDVAKQIRQLAPLTDVIFVTLNSSEAFVREALRIGTCGYVLKTEASRDLRPAVEAVLQKTAFASSGIQQRASGEGQTSETVYETIVDRDVSAPSSADSKSLAR